jgi:hypothetical protein
MEKWEEGCTGSAGLEQRGKRSSWSEALEVP